MHQVVKFYAWEEAFVSRLKGKRLEEAAHLSVFWCYKAAIVALTVLGTVRDNSARPVPPALTLIVALTVLGKGHS